MKIQVLRQRHSSGCGPTSIKMVSDYFKLGHSAAYIEQLCGEWKKEGMGNEDLVTALKKLGLKISSSYASTWRDVMEQNQTNKVIVVSWMLKGYIGHFSVVDKVDSEHIWLADPESGKIVKLDRLVFMRLWFDYEDMDYPEKSSDFKLRWMAVIERK